MKHKYTVEFAVGFKHGSWKLEEVEVEVEEDNTANEHEFELHIADVAQEEIEELLGYNKDRVFFHLLYFDRTVEKKP